ncbi:MAG: DUF1043 family protein [Gammaproteobacteria bacterium]|nr:DUF1043 family protein [Gammaproteobacteria bacterium]
MTAALVAIFSLILGLVCGLLFGRATNAPYQEAQELKDSLNQAQSEFDAYKVEVTQHFTKTAELVNSMTDNYRNVHTHLAGGAQTLCSGALQLESMNDKGALEAQAEEVTATEEVQSSTEAAANDDSSTPAVETVDEKTANNVDTVVAASTTETEVEQIKVDADTVASAEEKAAVATTAEETVPEELVADVATEKNQSEKRIH